MKLLLIRPKPSSEEFGLGPFFRVEPLGLEYLGAAARSAGHTTVLVDERFDSRAVAHIRRLKPQVVGISVPHALEYDAAIQTARLIRRSVPGAFVVAGGSAAASYSTPIERPDFDAICIGDGETTFPALLDALERGDSLRSVPGLRLRTPQGWASTPEILVPPSLDTIPLPARDLVSPYRKRYHCVQLRPVWLIETARGCPFRCRFCSVWQLHGRTYRERSIGSVVEDFQTTGDNIFIVDDLFWNHEARSLELAAALKKKGMRKNWILVQSRADLVAHHSDLLAAWRPLAHKFDIFFGFEGVTDAYLASLQKDSGVNQTIEAIEVARSMAYGTTGNFVVDPDWEELDFQRLWEFVRQHGLQRAGYSILTPLPGTEYYQSIEPALRGQPWFKYDMSHVLWAPKLGVKRFFELYTETWRRSVLNTAGQRSWWYWLRQVRLNEISFLIKVLRNTQRLMNAEAYLAEHQTGPPVHPLAHKEYGSP
jgi:hopanoid C-3 methylase